MVVLSGCGIRVTWQFPPRIKRCPWKNCLKGFGVRSDAIVHFKRNHAERSTLCHICNKPILMRRFGDINHHYRRRHPNVNLPSYLDKSSKKKETDDKHTNVKSQTKRFRSKSCSENESQPTKEIQKKSRLSCPLKHCSYETVQMTELCTHWTQNHDELEFPQFRDKPKSAYADATPKSTMKRKVKNAFDKQIMISVIKILIILLLLVSISMFRSIFYNRIYQVDMIQPKALCRISPVVQYRFHP